MKGPLLAVGLFALMTALVAGGSPVRAQPVASINLPNPGGTEQLYPWCNNISLTFPDGTRSEDVVQAVTPTGAVESMWRHNRAQNRFEGFSPAYPQASDLLTVNFLDSVWLCVTEAPGATAPPPGQPPPGQPPPGQPPPGQPPPPPVITPETVLTADLALTDVYPDYLPVGSLYIRITNHGPHSVKGISVDFDCFLWWWSSSTPLTTSQWINPGVVIYLDPGQTVAVPMNAQVHTDQYLYVAGCYLGVPMNIDPNTANNSYSENIP